MKCISLTASVIAGGALILFGFVVSSGDGLGYSLTGPLFG